MRSLWNVFKRLRETIHLFLQGQPDNVDRSVLINQLSAVKGVDSLHNIRIWSLDGEHHVFSAHAVISSANTVEEIKRIKKELKENIGRALLPQMRPPTRLELGRFIKMTSVHCVTRSQQSLTKRTMGLMLSPSSQALAPSHTACLKSILI